MKKLKKLTPYLCAKEAEGIIGVVLVVIPVKYLHLPKVDVGIAKDVNFLYFCMDLDLVRNILSYNEMLKYKLKTL